MAQSVAADSKNTVAKMRVAVVYFSRSGNTASVAKAVQAMTGADTFEVKTVKPYPEAYKPTTEVVKEELEKNIIREVQPIDIDLSKYDVVVLATHLVAPHGHAASNLGQSAELHRQACDHLQHPRWRRLDAHARRL